MLDRDGLDGVHAEEAARRPQPAERAERARVITPPPLPDGAPPGAAAAPSDVAPSGVAPFEVAPADADAAPPVPSLAPRTPRALLAAPVVLAAAVVVAWLVGARPRPAPAADRTPPPASRPVVAPPAVPPAAPIDAILPARFAFNERTPRGEAREIAAVAARCQGASVVLTGHADALGSAQANDEIALARADAVRALLVAAGLDAARVRIASAGATQPIASNASARGRRDNRRVTLHCEPHNGGEP